MKPFRLPFQNHLSARFVLSLSLLLSVIMFISLGVLLRQQQASIFHAEEQRASFMAEGLLASLQTFMLTGNGPLARDWLDRVKEEPGVINAQVIRRNGHEAFLDLDTIHQVNKFLETDAFSRSALPAHTVTDLPQAQFERAVHGEKVVIRNTVDQHLTYLLPVQRLDACEACHGYETNHVRGILRVTTSIAESQAALIAGRNNSIIVGVCAMFVLMLSLLLLVRRQVILPVQRLNQVAERIVGGDLEAEADVTWRGDEIDRLGGSFNRMTRRLIKQLAQSEELSQYYHHLLNNLSNGVVVYDAGGTITYVNQRMLDMGAYTQEEYLQKAHHDFCPPGGEREAMEPRIRHAERSFTEVLTLRRKDDSKWMARITIIPLNDASGALKEVLEISEDITEDQKRQEEIQWLSSIPEMNPFPIIEVNGETAKVLYVNPATEDYLKLRGHQPDDIPSILPDEFDEAVKICRTQHESIDTVSFAVGEDIMIWQLHPNSHNDHVRAYAIDVTNQVHAEQEAMQMALHDTLTGLPNRRLFFDRLQQAFAQNRRTNTQLAVLMIDLDHFKPINDTLGHDAGDTALKTIAERFTKCLRETDVASRHGGDEFAAILTNINSIDDVEKIAKHIIKVFSEPMQIGDQECKLGASIGIAISETGDAKTTTVSTDGEPASEGDLLLHNADIAMYAAKDGGRNTYRMYHEGMADT